MRIFLGLLTKSDKCEGRTKNASNKDAIRQKITDRGIYAINLPKSPDIKTKGANAAIVVDTEPKTGQKTSFVPLIAAS